MKPPSPEYQEGGNRLKQAVLVQRVTAYFRRRFEGELFKVSLKDLAVYGICFFLV